jgi:L-glyceraldehyde 3-phosphate reductase
VPLLIYQGRLNLIDRAPQEEGILDYCQQHGIGFISFSPLAQGLLTDRYLGCTVDDKGEVTGIPQGSRMTQGRFLKPAALTPAMLYQLKQFNSEAEAQGKTLAEMALSWILEQQGVTSVLVGASSAEQLAKNLRCI